MDFRAVLIPLCVLFTQARCSPAGSRDAEKAQTINFALMEIRIARDHLDEPLPDFSCPNLNVPEHVGLKQQPLSAHSLSTVRCYVQELSKWTPEVSERLTNASQFIKNVEELLSNPTTPQSCSLPVFKDNHAAFKFAKCFLDLVLEERPSKSTL